jgi:UDP-N-acetylmuramoyl-tripeptide--D-alanyl-D-alanine ligase
MLNLTLNEIIEAIHGEVVKSGKEKNYLSVSTDTRNLENNSIFIALRGENFNGNDYAAQASNKGAAVCIVDEILNPLSDYYEDTAVIKVEDSKKALLKLAKYYRSKLKVKVIGITGSTGKTSTKDIVAAMLGSKYKVFKTKGNFNNEIGLPLMIFKLTDEYEVAVLEMGMSNLGEIHRLADVARPDIGIITNIGVSHLEYLITRENILKAKLEITDFFNSSNILIINYDNDLLKTVDSLGCKILKVSTEENYADYKAENIMLNEESIQFKVAQKVGNLSPEFSIAIPGKHNVQNSLLAIACGKELGLSYEEMIEGISNIQVTSMRLDVVKGAKFTIIDDCYNASPDSMKAALDVLENVSGHRKIAVLGTMKELGEEAFKLHKEIGVYASAKNIDLLITMGDFSKAFQEGFNKYNEFIHLQSNKEISEYLKRNVLNKDVILVKASRSMKFETIVNELKLINC